MTVQEAIKRINDCRNTPNFQPYNYVNEALDMAIESMNEVEQYRALGTVEELKAAMEKQVAKKPTFKGDFIGFYECECGGIVEKSMSYCCECGKKLDWSKFQ